MTAFLPRIVPAFAAIALCAASAPPTGGTISVEQADGVGAAGSAAADLTDGLSEALAAHGFTMLGDPGHSAYVAEVTFDQTVVGAGSVKANERVTAAPGLFGAAGGGVTVPLSGRRARAVTLERFRLDLRIRSRRSGLVVWRGVAVTVRSLTGPESVRAAATSLGAAALRSYPNEPPGVVSVP